MLLELIDIILDLIFLKLMQQIANGELNTSHLIKFQNLKLTTTKKNIPIFTYCIPMYKYLSMLFLKGTFFTPFSASINWSCTYTFLHPTPMFRV